MNKNKCPFCSEENVDQRISDSVPIVSYVKCSLCGEFEYAPRMVSELEDEQRSKISVLLQVRKLRGLGRICLLDTVPAKTKGLCFDPIDKASFLNGWPSGSRFVDEVLLNLSFLYPAPGKPFKIETDAANGHIRPWAYALYDPDVKGAQKTPLSMLIQAGLLLPHGSLYMITDQGWKRIEALRGDESSTAFVAMWFDDSLNGFKRAIEEAVALAGYRAECLTVDEVEHNEYIMDKVINLINDARFVIADFTCVPETGDHAGGVKGGSRGGVYFEAGYAKGRGKEVILTCRNDDASKCRRHFDIQQINTIFWEDSGEGIQAGGQSLSDVLKNRILASIGKGPLSR
jgi:nucleoside 2-deoxyribosyltransferase